MGWQLYLSLSIMMGLEFAVWGAWSPVLAARLLGPLKMSGKQTGWIYGTIPIACIVSPLIAGQVADKWVATEWLLAGGHLAGAVLLFLAAKKQTFKGLFTVMLLYSMCYAFTLPLVNSLMFNQLGQVFGDKATVSFESGKIFIWAPITWVVVGLMLTGWRKIKGSGDGSDCLYFAAILSVIMGVFCFFLPHTPPPGAAGAVLPFVKAFSMLGDSVFLIFLIVSFIVTAQLQFYFLGTAQYLGDIGIKSSNVPAVMAIAQAAQIIATYFALGFLLEKVGFRWTLTIGILCWMTMYLVYAAEKPKILVILSMAFHGLGYLFFIIGGQIYVNSVADADIAASAQALLFMVTMGFGFLAGTRFTGGVMDKFSQEGKFQWRSIYIVPGAVMAVCAILFILLFKV